MAIGIDRQRRHQLLREHNERIGGMSDAEADSELSRLIEEGRTDPSRLDEGDWLLWLCVMAAHRANRLEIGAT